MKKIIAIQGYQGSYHEEAMYKYFGSNAEALNCAIFPDVLDAVRNGSADYGIVAIANNRYGFIPEPYDLLMQDSGESVQICGEVVLQIRHQLLGSRGATLADIKELHSQTPALGQCRKFIEEKLPKVTIIQEDDTALAAEKVALKADKSVAAIASKQAGELYNLATIESGVQDDDKNLTRFVVLRKKNISDAKGANKTSILLETNNTAGSLVDALVLFKESGINLGLLHSSFVANSEFTMRFFLEFDAGWPDEKTHYVVEKLIKDHKAKVMLLGSYKSAEKDK